MSGEWMDTLLQQLRQDEEYDSCKKHMLHAERNLADTLSDRQLDLFLEYLSVRSFLWILEIEEAYALGQQHEKTIAQQTHEGTAALSVSIKS